MLGVPAEVEGRVRVGVLGGGGYSSAVQLVGEGRPDRFLRTWRGRCLVTSLVLENTRDTSSDLRPSSFLQLVQLMLTVLEGPLEVIALLAHALEFDNLLITLHANALYLLGPFVQIFRP